THLNEDSTSLTTGSVSLLFNTTHNGDSRPLSSNLEGVPLNNTTLKGIKLPTKLGSYDTSAALTLEEKVNMSYVPGPFKPWVTHLTFFQCLSDPPTTGPCADLNKYVCLPEMYELWSTSEQIGRINEEIRLLHKDVALLLEGEVAPKWVAQYKKLVQE